MKKLIYSTALAGLVAAAPALADNATYQSPPSAGYTSTTTTMHSESTSRRMAATEPAAGGRYDDDNFRGPYVGADIGYGFGSHEVSNPGGADGDAGIHGTEGGVFAGYGWSNPGSDLAGYIGTELGYGFSGADGNIGGLGIEKNDNLTAAIKPGMVINRDTLAYGIVGYSRAEFEAAGDDERLDGLMLGAGSEFATGTPVNMRVEYTYTDYEDANLGGVDINGEDSAIKVGAVGRF